MLSSKLSRETEEQMVVKLHEYYELERDEKLIKARAWENNALACFLTKERIEGKQENELNDPDSHEKGFMIQL